MTMKKEKHFSCQQLNDEKCFTINQIIEMMKDADMEEVTIADVKRIIGDEFFFCKEFGEPCSHDDSCYPCGHECKHYAPRNGKSGCCKNRGYLYEPNNEFTLKIDGTITPKNS